MQLTLRANLKCMTELSLSGERNTLLTAPFSVDTTLSVQNGEYVLLAAAPHSTEAGDAVALVVRVTRDQKH